MVDVRVKQAKPATLKPLLVDTTITPIPDTTTCSPIQSQPKQSKIKRILKKSHNPESQADDTSLENIVYRLKRRVDALSKFNIQETIDKYVKTHLKQIGLPKDVPDFLKIKQEKATQQSRPKVSLKPFNNVALSLYDKKDNLYKMMREFKAYNKHPTHQALFDALTVSLNADKDSKKKKRKDHDASSSKKIKELPTSSKDTTSSKSSKPDKTMQENKIVKDLDQEAGMDEELAIDEVVNEDEHPQDHVALSEKIPQDLSKPQHILGAPSHLYILVDFFFNKDLEYIRSRNLEEKKYAMSLTKPKATRYELYGIKEMIPNLPSPSKVAYDKDATYKISH
nr:hypothetical protein [Tanacetum cinerariifolium]